jgi:hypothetical protein
MPEAVTPPAMMTVPIHLREIAGADVARHRRRERSDRGRVRGARKRRESQSRNRKYKCRSDHSVLLEREAKFAIALIAKQHGSSTAATDYVHE